MDGSSTARRITKRLIYRKFGATYPFYKECAHWCACQMCLDTTEDLRTAQDEYNAVVMAFISEQDESEQANLTQVWCDRLLADYLRCPNTLDFWDELVRNPPPLDEDTATIKLLNDVVMDHYESRCPQNGGFTPIEIHQIALIGKD